MRCARRVGPAMAVLLLWQAAVAPRAVAVAQTTGTLRGAVVDESGSAVPGVQVAMTGVGVRREAVTGADGAYEFGGLAAGEYRVSAFHAGYVPAEVQATVGAGATEAPPIVLRTAWLLDTLSVVPEEPTVFARNLVAGPMMRQQPQMTGVTAVVDNLPGVSVQEGDAYGFDDWSSNIAVRGFQVTLSEAQIGTTIDGFPNGTSDYFSGAKASRFIDALNLGGVEASQGTADIASRSVEALGGTFDYRTDAPAAERGYTASVTLGEYEGQRFAARVETGSLFGGGTRAWVAAARQEATDWVQGSARNEREHLAAKFVSSHGRLNLTGYLSYDDIHEDDYQRLYSDADFRENPRSDRLIGDWPGVPYLNQFYRPGWQTRRTNTLAYVKADWSFSELASLGAGAYYHHNWGRGDWLPPYIVDVVDDGGGPESELAGLPPVRGGSQIRLIRFVDGDGVAVAPTPGCTSSYIFNFYGSGGPEVDPACHPGATAVQSYRHSHYGKDRLGVTLDGEWSVLFGAGGSALRAGIWYEDSRRDLGRTWHRVLDPTVGLAWDRQAYWHQYEWDFPQDVFKWYLEETLYVGRFALTAGVKQFLIGLSRDDQFGVGRTLDLDSDSDLLFSGGVTYETPVAGLDLFAGYADNFKAINSTLPRSAGPEPGPVGTRDRLERRRRASVHRRARGAERGLVHHRLPEPDLLPRPADAPQAPTTWFPAAARTSTRAASKQAASRSPPPFPSRPGPRSTPPSTLNDSKYIGTGDPLVDEGQGIVPGTDVTGVPSRLWVLSLDRAGPLGGGLSAKYTSSRRVSLTSDWYTDAYWLVDAYVSMSGDALSDRLRSAEFSITANNLFDKPYLSAIAENAAWLGAPRTISTTVTVSWF